MSLVSRHVLGMVANRPSGGCRTLSYLTARFTVVDPADGIRHARKSPEHLGS